MSESAACLATVWVDLWWVTMSQSYWPAYSWVALVRVRRKFSTMASASELSLVALGTLALSPFSPSRSSLPPG